MDSKEKLRGKDAVVAPLCEAALIAIAGLAGWLIHAPLLFASLGPTAYEMVETPERKSARPYNVFLGHLIGVLAALGTVWIMHAGAAPAAGAGGVPLLRVGAAAIAAGLTVLVTLPLKASQPAATATTLLISLGLMPGWRGGAEIMAAVLLMLLVGEPVRHWRERDRASVIKVTPL